jgi:hypothetical protein
LIFRGTHSFRLPCVHSVLGGRHIAVSWQGVVMIYWPWRAGAEQEGDEEEEGH